MRTIVVWILVTVATMIAAVAGVSLDIPRLVQACYWALIAELGALIGIGIGARHVASTR